MTTHLNPPCPHCGGRRRYGHGSTATCADCNRFVAPELIEPRATAAAETQTDRILRSIARPGDTWVVRQ